MVYFQEWALEQALLLQLCMRNRCIDLLLHAYMYSVDRCTALYTITALMRGTGTQDTFDPRELVNHSFFHAQYGGGAQKGVGLIAG